MSVTVARPRLRINIPGAIGLVVVVFWILMAIIGPDGRQTPGELPGLL